MAGFIPAHRQQQFLKASADFFSWWLAELVRLLPQHWRRALSGQPALCRFVLEKNQLRLVLETQGREKAVGSTAVAEVVGLAMSGLFIPGVSVPDATLESDASTTKTLMANISALENISRRRVVLELADEYLLIRDISLPLVSDDDIASVLAHEIDRLTPFAKNNVCYAYEILQKNTQTAMLSLRLMCLERSVLEGVLAQCEELGLGVTEVGRQAQSSSPGPSAATADLLPADRRPQKEKLWNRGNQLLAALAGVLLLAVLILPVWHYEKQIEGLSIELSALQEQSRAVRAKQARMVEALDIRDALVQRKNSELEKIIILHELTRLIPDNTWLTRLTLRDSSLEIDGESDKSSDLIEKLESGAVFYQVKFASSVTRNSRSGKERFQIKMKVSDKPVISPHVSVLEARGAAQLAAGATIDE
ncbi:hypothetical protein A9Q89_04670 [Gammaproteobacteria bacterium 53_120_T64]|nr:hypothetical protein A9Q89_04670 [Gammaproteobacteria bacterium 53_120_T64]